MRKHKKHHSKKIGMPPGSLIYVGQADNDVSQLAKPIISLLEYDATDFVERTLSIDDLAILNISENANKKFWLNIHGVHDVALIKQIGDLFNLHPLVQEDILNTQQRPKIDEYDDYLFLEARSFKYDQANMAVDSEQISFVLGRNYLLTFQERSTGIFGMNFHEMPWLAEKNGFWWVMGLMVSIALLMIMIFWRRQWLSSKT